MTIIALVLLALALLVGGALLLRAGLRGRRVDDAPLCRACGFELTGLPAGSNCPECGADVGRPANVTVGHRRRRPGAVLLGIALLLAPLVVGGTLVSGIDPTPYKPAWWLMRELDARNPATVSAALGELSWRQAAGKLSKASADGLFDHALAQQADASKPWDPVWGVVLESGRILGTLDDARWSRYARQAFDFKLEVRPRVRQGDPLAVRFTTGKPRLASLANFEATYTWQSIQVGSTRLDPPPLRRRGRFVVNASRPSWGGTAGETNIEGGVTESLPIGAAEVVGTVVFDISDARGSGFAGPALAAGKVSVANKVQILPRDTPQVYTVDDPKLLPAMRACVTVDLYRVVSADGRCQLRYDVTVADPPAALNHEVVASRGGVEVRCGSVNEKPTAAGRSSSSRTGLVDEPDWPRGRAKTVDVTLRPDLNLVMHDVDPTPIWGGELIFKNVPIRPARQ